MAEVTEMYLAGASATQIERRFSAEWSTAPRNVRRYLRAARQLIAVEAKRLETDAGHKQLRAEMREILRGLLFRAVTEGEIGVAAKIAEQLTRFDALMRPAKSEIAVTHDIGPHTDNAVLVAVMKREIAHLERVAA